MLDLLQRSLEDFPSAYQEFKRLTASLQPQPATSLVEAQDLAANRVIVTYYLSYASARDLVPIIKKFLTSRGEVQADERTNALIVRDIPNVMPGVEQRIRELDVKTPPAPPTLAPPTLALSVQPANVQVYVDDVFKGMTSADGRLVVQGLAPGAHRVRMNLIGYTEAARTVELKPGETATIEAKLEPAGPKPLALGEIEEALTNGLPPKGITKLVNQYGVDFALTKPIEQRLRDKGADSDLLVAIATNKK